MMEMTPGSRCTTTRGYLVQALRARHAGRLMSKAHLVPGRDAMDGGCRGARRLGMLRVAGRLSQGDQSRKRVSLLKNGPVPRASRFAMSDRDDQVFRVLPRRAEETIAAACSRVRAAGKYVVGNPPAAARSGSCQRQSVRRLAKAFQGGKDVVKVLVHPLPAPVRKKQDVWRDSAPRPARDRGRKAGRHDVDPPRR